MNTLALPSIAVPPPWRRPLLLLLAVLALVLAAYWPTAATMVGIWYRSDNFAHAFVVPPIALWLIWRRRAALARLPVRPQPAVALGMLLLALAWALGDLVAVNVVTQFALVGMLVAAVPATLGWPVTRELAFPLAFLFFAVPFGEFMTPWLMQYTADFAVAALRASGVPVYREGLKFVIPTGHWSVVEECSGIRYLMASAMVGSLFAYLNYRSWWRRAAFMVAALAMPVLANWVRAYLIVMLGHLSGNKLAAGVDHILYGWLFFGIVIMTMFFVGARWAEDQDPSDGPASPNGRSGDDATAGRWASGFAVAALACLLPVAALRAGLGDAGATASPTVLRLPDLAGTRWAEASPSLPELVPKFVGAQALATRLHGQGADQVGLQVAWYGPQREDAKLVSSVNVLVRANDPDWNLMGTGRHTRAARVGPQAVRETHLLGPAPQAGGVRPPVLVWQFYWIDGRLTASDLEAKLLQAWLRLRGHSEAGALVLVYALDRGDGVARLDGFLTETFPALDAALRAMRTPAVTPGGQN